MTGVVIIGIGETKVGRHPGLSAVDLQSAAVRAALADCGLSKQRVGAIYTVGSYIRPMSLHALSIAENLGMRPLLASNVDVGGTVAFISMMQQASAAIADGRIDAAVCVYGDNAATGRPANMHGFVPLMEQGTEDFEDPFGSSIVVSYALLAQRYLSLHGLDSLDAFAPIAISAYRNASLNDNAIKRKPITADDYLASPWIAAPFRKIDCSPVVDGAGAFVVASTQVAAQLNLGHPVVKVLGSGMSTTHKIVSQAPDLPDLGFAEAGRQAFAEAGVEHDAVDLLTIHDGFTASVAIAAEALGFFPPGDCGRFAARGAIDFDGALPINPHGGLIGQGHVGGVLHVVEAVRQLRGEAGARQVNGAEIAGVAGVGNIFSICGMMLLARGQ